MKSKLQYVFLFLLLSGISTLPVVSLLGSSFLYNEKKIFQLAVLIVSGLICFFSANKKNDNFIYPILLRTKAWIIIPLILLAFISSLISNHPFYALVEISLFLMLFFLALLVSNIVIKTKYIVWLIFGAAIFYIFIYSIKFWIDYSFYISGLVSFTLWPGDVAADKLLGYSNIRFFNQVQAFTLPLLIGGAVITFSKQKLAGYFLLLLSTIWWMLLIQSAGRGVILATLSAGVSVLILFKSSTHRWVWIFIGTLAVGYVAKILFFEILPGVEQTKSILRGDSGRLTLWPKLFWTTFEKPILGHGPMSFASIHTDYFRGHPHNSVLQLLYEFGYSVTLAIIGSVFYGIKKWVDQTKEKISSFKHGSTEYIVLRISFTAALIGGLIYSLFSGVIVMPLSQLWLAIIAGSMTGLYIREKVNIGSEFSINNWQLYATKFVVLCATAMLVSVLVRDVPNLRGNEEQFFEKTEQNKFRPRFWQQGKIGLDSNPSKDKQSQQ